MRFTALDLKGAYSIDLEPIGDDRGFFARSWDAREFEKHGLNPRIAQCNVSYNRVRGTIRGLHFQIAPGEEAKLVRCIRGSIFDVIVDLRQGSGTFGRWSSIVLTDENRLALYVPEGFAHGFETLSDETEVLYHMSEYYAPDLARGVRWNDPSLAISWPISDPIVSERDSSYALLTH
jgi:dTDP-4-dehydrorhamnose 3,5-epimerase